MTEKTIAGLIGAGIIMLIGIIGIISIIIYDGLKDKPRCRHERKSKKYLKGKATCYEYFILCGAENWKKIVFDFSHDREKACSESYLKGFQDAVDKIDMYLDRMPTQSEERVQAQEDSIKRLLSVNHELRVKNKRLKNRLRRLKRNLRLKGGLI